MRKPLASVFFFILIFGTCQFTYADDDPPPQLSVENFMPASGSNVPEYVDPTGKIPGVIQYADGYTGRIISREEFIAQNQRIQNQFMSGTNRILGEAKQYLSTASDGEDRVVTESTITGIEQSQRDVASMHSQNIAQAEALKPKVQYDKPKVLVSR